MSELSFICRGTEGLKKYNYPSVEVVESAFDTDKRCSGVRYNIFKQLEHSRKVKNLFVCDVVLACGGLISCLVSDHHVRERRVYRSVQWT